MSESPIPAIRAILMCDTVIQEAGTGKKTLVGVFDRFVFPNVPAQIGGFTFFARITDLNGSYSFRIDVVDLREDKKLARIETNEFTHDDPLGSMDLVLPIPPIRFINFGKHEFQLYANNIYLGRCVIDVTKLE